MKHSRLRTALQQTVLLVAPWFWIFDVLALDPSKPDQPTDLAAVQVTQQRQTKETASYAPPTTQRIQRGVGRMIIPRLARTAKAQETDDRKGCDGKSGGETGGNPVVLYTGNKVEHELDFAAGGEMGLFLKRTYNHHWSATGIFGNHWLSNFDYSLVPSQNDDILWAQRPDGRRVRYLRDTASGRWFEDKAQPISSVTRNADGSYRLHGDDGSVEDYAADGYIARLQNEQGVAWTFSYTGKYLQKVTHASGRSIQLGWNKGQLTQVTDPAGNVYRYAYTANAFGQGRHRLASSTLPGAPETTVTYHYEDARYPGGLTGKSFNGVRYSTFAYDNEARAVLSEHAGGIERHQFSYTVHSTEGVEAPPAPSRPGGNLPGESSGWCVPRGANGTICYHPASLPGGSVPMLGSAPAASMNATATATNARTRAVKVSVTTTNPSGRRTTSEFDDGKLLAVTGEASPRCAASFKSSTYDANDNPDLVHDFEDNLTDFDYDARGLLLKRREAVQTNAQRTTVWEWDDEKHRVVKETVQGVLETSYGYDARGNISSVTQRNLMSAGVQDQLRTFTHQNTYHSNGLMATRRSDGPLAQDDVTSTFSATGDLLTVRNGLGHQITYGNYNGLGLPGKVTAFNGDETRFDYDARGRIVVQRQRISDAWATTSFTYDAAGDIASITGADGVTTRFTHDAGRRLTQQARPLGDGTYAWTQHSYDDASNLIRTEVRNRDYPLGSAIIGYIDLVTHDANWNWSVQGWACTSGSNRSIDVHAYAEGNAALGAFTANQPSEPIIATMCGAAGSNYRFSIPITLAQRQQLGGRLLTVYGISPEGGASNAALHNANAVTVPPAPVIGDIAGITQDSDWNYSVEGWSCAVGMSQPAPVSLHAGGPPGQGTHLGSFTGTRIPNEDMKAVCQGTGAHWFKLPLDINVRNAHGNQALHVTGLSPAGHGDAALNRSGTFTIPAITRTAEVVGVSASPDYMMNGQRSRITAQYRNTGNVVWHGDNHLAWGNQTLNQSSPLPHSVAPGQTVTFQFNVAPVRQGTGMQQFTYITQLASGGSAWGPQGSTSITVENPGGWCNPSKPNCEEPISIEPSIGLEPKEGAH